MTATSPVNTTVLEYVIIMITQKKEINETNSADGHQSNILIWLIAVKGLSAFEYLSIGVII